MKLIVISFLTMSVISVGYWSYSVQNRDGSDETDYHIGKPQYESQVLIIDDQKSNDAPVRLDETFYATAEIGALYPMEERYAAYSEQLEMPEYVTLAGTESIQQVVAMLAHRDLALRLIAVESLSEYQHDDINSLLLDALYDPEPLVRAKVAESLGMQHDETLLSYLEPVLYDADQNVRIAAILAIADLESEQGIYALAPLLSDSHADIRFNAMLAMGEIGGAACVDYLQNHRYDSDERIRRNVAAILHELEAEY
ncbi:MAG: HEAT repeat domain-containing protein [Candidatus Thiodiazotropha sp. (ex. Lucinisca nassula)]|nr:HEAT repeat domain-containing protein [Candidatus Thiodiazotropha sp. (ex. Lucinisca nassula)]